jgi:hypothetical protein
MTKNKKHSSLPGQLPLFDLIRESHRLTNGGGQPHAAGSLDIDSQFRAAVSEDLRYAVDAAGRPLSRFQVAARMSELVGREITATTLNNYTAEAHDKHRLPCQYLPAFVVATGGQRRAFDVLSRSAGLFALPGAEVLRAEIQHLDEDISRKKTEKLKRLLFLREIDKL